MVAVYDSRKSLSEAAVGADRVALVDEKGREGLYVFDASAHDGTAASNTVQFTSVGADGDTINVNGFVITLRSSAGGDTEVQISSTIAGTAENFKNHINLNILGRYGVTASRVGQIVTLTAKMRGLAGNLIALSTAGAPSTATPPVANPPPVRLGGPLLTGGTFVPSIDEAYITEEVTEDGTTRTNVIADERTHVPPTTPPAGTPTTATPELAKMGAYGVWIPKLTRIKPTYFGAYNPANAVNHHKMIQLAMEASARHGFIVDIDRRYEVIRYAPFLRVRSSRDRAAKAPSSPSALMAICSKAPSCSAAGSRTSCRTEP